jgi:putative ABC transport system permease protein
MINETAARALGWTPQEAVGKHFTHMGGERTIIGVVKDFHMQSMHFPIEPLIILHSPNVMQYISARVQTEDLPETAASLERSLKRFTPYPFEYQFLDEQFDELYKSEVRLGETIGFFTILALLIASLGLFGLAAFAAEQRTKEIGIRKVLGAKVTGLVALLSIDFLKLVAFAFVVGAPVAFFAMQRWLEDFAYRIDLGPGVFILAGGAALAIALLAVSYQSVRAALADPVKSLRYE